LKNLTAIWNKISNLGNSTKLSNDEILNLKLVNILCSIGIFFSFANLVMFSIKSSFTSTLISLCFLITLTALFVLNTKHYFITVKVSIIVIISAIISFIYLNYGSQIEVVPLYFVLMLLSIFLFNKLLHHILSIVFIATLFFASKLYIHYFGRLNQVEITLESPLTFMFFSVISFIVLIQSIKYRYNNYIDEKNERVKTLKIINDKYKASQLLLKKSNETLDDKNKELEQFVYIASHDLKAPLRNILSFNTLIKKKLENSTNEEVKNYVSFINESGLKMNVLIDSILDYGKLKKLDQQNKTKVDLNLLVKEISLMVIQNNSKEVKIYCEELPLIFAHNVAFEQLFKNIIENGIKYNESDLPSIKIWTESEDNQFVIYIKDNGIGIQEKYIDSVFEMFKRLHSNSEYEGTGIGLAICKKIVDMHDGTISIESEKGKGSIFKMQFPNSILSTLKESENTIISTR